MREAPDTGSGVAAEHTELLQSPHDRLAADADRLGQSLSGFIRSRAYDTVQQRHGRLHPRTKGEHPQAGQPHAAAPGREPPGKSTIAARFRARCGPGIARLVAGIIRLL